MEGNPFVISLYDVIQVESFDGTASVVLVMEYIQHDIFKVMKLL